VTPDQVDAGDSVILSWEASGSRASICPSARFVLFTDQDRLQVALVGTMAFTVPLEAKGLRFVSYRLQVEAQVIPRLLCRR